MSVLRELLNPIPLPPMVRIRQTFDTAKLDNPIAVLEQELRKPGAISSIQRGQRVAVAVGSRGIANIAAVVKKVVEELRAAGAEPFIVPSMGSHGGATAEGQANVLRHLGVTETYVNAPILASMEVIQLGELSNGLPVYVDRHVAEADAIVIVNRIKPHTAFRGTFESGIMKMISIGLGNQKGAEACHQLGFRYMAENMPAMARMIMAKLPIKFGVALVENAYDETYLLEVLPADNIEIRERELLEIAKDRLPKLMFPQIDVLVIDYIGKNISGDGMDPNITGRYPTPYASGGPEVSKMVVLDLTKETNGNANGAGAADFTTKRLVDKADWSATYANGLTSTVCGPTKIPTTLENDEMAIKAAVKTCNILDYKSCRLVRIRDTLHLGELEISEALLEEAKLAAGVEIISKPYQWQFDLQGNIK